MLRLNRQLLQIEEMTEHYMKELESVSSQIQTMEKGLIQFYKYKSMDNELSNRLESMKKDITIKYKEYLQKELNEVNHQQLKIKSSLSKYEEYRNTKKEEFKNTLNLVRQERDITFNKLETYNITSEFTPVYTPEEFQKMNLKEINMYLGDVLDLCKEIQEVNLQVIPMSEINPNIWFVADRININNKSAEQMARAVNIITILALIGKFSPIIFGGLTTFTAVTIVKNKRALKPIKTYKDFIYTAYNNENVIEGKINYIVDSGVDQKTNELEQELEILQEKEMEIRDKNEIRMKQEIEEAEDSFHRDLDKHSKSIETEMNNKLVKLTEVSKTMQETLTNVFNNILFELDTLQSDIMLKIHEANEHNIEIINNNTLLDLNRIHLGREEVNKELKRFENMPFGSYLFIYGDNRESLQKLLMYITTQIAGRIRGDLIKFNILDPVDYGKGVDIISSKQMSMYYNTEEVGEVIDLQIKKFTEDVKNMLMGYNNIMDYNKQKNSTGSALYPYTLNIIQNLDIFADTTRYRQLLRTTQSGVINLVMMSKNMLLKAQKNVIDNEVEKDAFLELLNLFPIMFNDIGDNLVEMEVNRYYSVENVSDITEGFKKIVDYMNNTIEDNMIDINILANDHGLEQISISPYELEEDAQTREIEEMKERKREIEQKNIELEKMGEDLIEYEDEVQVVKFIPEQISEKDFRDYGKLIAQNIKDASVTIYYFEEMMERVKNQLGDTLFSREPASGVCFPIGYENGDVDSIFEVPFNDYHIHAFMGGRTGMGKSNMSNVGLNSALRLYSPNALHLYYLDGKQAEGAKYMRNVTPHFKCLATTSDPDYLLSLFENIFNQMVWRQKVLLAEYNAGKLGDIREKYYEYISNKEEYRKSGRDYDKEIYDRFKGNEDRIKEFKGTEVAEILIVIDELAEILKGEPETINQILKYIDSFSALGRATGVHLWLMSQGVPDKLDASTMAQIVTRLALPVSTGAVSKALVGNESAADPDYQGKGNLLFNDRGGDRDSNVRIKVPIIQPEDMDKNLSEIREKGIELGFPIECVVFDFDEEVYYEDDLEPFLIKNKDSLKEGETKKIVVGDNVLFTDTPAPVGFDLGTEEGDNIVIISQSSKKRIELTNTVISNFAKTNGEDTYLLVYRGNKDFQHWDYTEKYKDDFKDIIEVESVDEFVTEIQGQPLRNLEVIIRKHGLGIVTKLDNIEDQDIKIQPDLYLLQNLVNVKPELVDFIKDIGVNEEVNNRIVDRIINFMRDSVPLNVMLVEGSERISGLGTGLDYNLGDTIKDAMLTSPYYNMYIIFTGSLEPQSFSKLESCFRHALLGNLDIMALTKYKFMRDAPSKYGGYMNLINPKGFKYKVFSLPEVKDDVQDDPRVLI